ncbi:hypothetical protein JNUCC0626_47295 [Lentzea sp. JNUCC 0626]|uniref:hypothetical protein n=1 Tax=Lentzea sp. JNUCC 0626 TaxID=3367513 RepID=UPI003748FED6
MVLALVAGLITFSVRYSYGLAKLLLRQRERASDATNQVTGGVHGDVNQIGTVHGDLIVNQICPRCRDSN